MLFLSLSILCSTSILILFKLLDKRGLNTFSAIIINYFVASVLGFFLGYSEMHVFFENPGRWMLFALIIGVSFVIMFYIIAITTQKLGITVSSVSGRMSVIIPIVFSILYENEVVGSLKVSGIVFALVALFLMVFRENNRPVDRRLLFLPFIMFFGMGTIDSLIKYSQAEFLESVHLTSFMTLLFGISAISAFLFHLIRPKRSRTFSKKTVLFGLVLGLVNFGSLYFFVLALSHSGVDSSIIFGINNLGIVTLSILVALLVFQEKLSKLNWVGVLLSLITIIILSISG